MKPKSSRPFAPLVATLLGVAFVGAACSSSSTDDTSLESAGGTGAKGGSASGGSSATAATGGSANGTGTGGSANATGSGGSATGGSSNATGTGGTGNRTGTGGSANATSGGGSGAYPTSACMGAPFDSASGQGGESSATCTGVAAEAEPVPIDLFIMMDRSISMKNLVAGTNTTRWEALQAAVQEFAQNSNGDDVRAGIGFFGVTGGNDDAIDCNAGNYAKAAVEIGPLADVGGDLVAAMAKMKPGGLTPAGPALTGALQYASAWAMDNVGRATAVVLVSDGYPTQCEPMAVSDLATIAQNAHENAPYVRTYAIGLGGDVNLDAIALAGGTHKAFRVDEGDIGGSFSAALHNVANTKLACEYALPPPPSGSQILDLERVQVTYTAGDGTVEEIPAVSGLSSCANAPNGGWYYDNPNDPTAIEVCPCTCTRFEAGAVDIRLGCRPLRGPR